MDGYLDTTITVAGVDGRQFVCRLVRAGERYGRDRVFELAASEEPIVQFFDRNNRFENGDYDERTYGQFTGGSYHARSLLDHESGRALALDLGIPVWTVAAGQMLRVHRLIADPPARAKREPVRKPTPFATGNI
jgi:hypothetical protein